MEILLPTLNHQRKAFIQTRDKYISEHSFNRGYQACRKYIAVQLPRPYENEIVEPLKTPMG